MLWSRESPLRVASAGWMWLISPPVSGQDTESATPWGVTSFWLWRPAFVTLLISQEKAVASGMNPQTGAWSWHCSILSQYYGRPWIWPNKRKVAPSWKQWGGDGGSGEKWRVSPEETSQPTGEHKSLAGRIKNCGWNLPATVPVLLLMLRATAVGPM